MDSISKLTYRRFLLGKQGLWPGRRFKGVKGVEAALRQMDLLQLDPLNIVARSQEIAMYGRVLDYQPEHLYKMAYEQRKAFDYGGWLCMYPMNEFPYWRLPMKRREEKGLRWESYTH
ncbi:MAG TPA: crosslink repair DNA glycosylase YcaQ family protein, partial [Anaerolineales bacterium]|nr:crosslink repair DNA glycosylase YcaQ family protein [Anaerolineales bacterium]